MNDSRSMSFIAALLTLIPMTGAAGDVDPLQGCWRSQQIQITHDDNSRHDQNGDCVTQYDATHATSRCFNEAGNTESVQSYEHAGAGTLHVTSLDPQTLKPNGTTTFELRYRIEDQWLLTERQQFPAASQASSTAKPPVDIKSVSIRVKAAQGKQLGCVPYGNRQLRIGRTPTSSLALTVPSGWQAWFVDPAKNKELALGMSNSLFVGAFVAAVTAGSGENPHRFVLVFDDLRYGPSPVRRAEFGQVKERFKRELGAARLMCDEADRVCALLHASGSGQVYAELLNVKGRVAMISSVMDTQADTEQLRVAAKTFAEQLRQDNPE
jgi:hypothetical protein